MTNETMSLLVPIDSENLTKKLARACKRCGVSLTQLEGQTTFSRVELRPVNIGETDAPMMQFNSGEVIQSAYREVVLHSKFDRWTLGGFPGVSGYEFVCRIKHTQAGNIIAGPETVEGWKEAKPTCDHCNKTRHRKDTFVLRHTETGALVRVGRNCLADFLRADPTQLVRFSEICRMVADEDSAGGWGGRWVPETSVFLACAVAEIERVGFRKSGHDYPTKRAAEFLSLPCPRHNGNAEKEWKDGQPKTEHFETADKILEWLKTDCATASSDYLSNLHVISQLDCVSDRHMGLLASAPVAYAKAKEIELQKAQEKAALPESNWIGTPKAKVEFTGTLLRTRDVESMYGTKTLYVFRTDDGSDVTWWNSGRCPLRAEQSWGDFISTGDRVSVKGTVKSHDEYQGRKQTTILRAKVTYLSA